MVCMPHVAFILLPWLSTVPRHLSFPLYARSRAAQSRNRLSGMHINPAMQAYTLG